MTENFIIVGAGVRGLAQLPDEVLDLLKETSTLGRRQRGLHAASATLASKDDEVCRVMEGRREAFERRYRRLGREPSYV